MRKLIDGKKIDISKKINLEYLKENKILSKSITHFKILGKGDIKTQLNIVSDFSSKSAKNKIEKAGGSIIIKSNKD